MTLWSISRSPLIFGGNLPNNTVFTKNLITNAAVLDMHAHSSGNKQLFRNGDLVAWTANDTLTGDKYLALFNAGEPDNYVWASDTITRSKRSQNFDIALDSPDKLYLIAEIVDDNKADHADWIKPIFYTSSTDSVLLTTLTWDNATTAWGSVLKNKQCEGNSLKVNGVTYANGIGTHAYSKIQYTLNASYIRFKGMVGLDDAGANQTSLTPTIQFKIYTSDPSKSIQKTILVNLVDIGMEGNVTVTDMWSGTNLGTFNGTFSRSIYNHRSGLYKLSKTTSHLTEDAETLKLDIYSDNNSIVMSGLRGDESINVYNLGGTLVTSRKAMNHTEKITIDGKNSLHIVKVSGRDGVVVAKLF